MATRTKSRTSNRTTGQRRSQSGQTSAFSWGSNAAPVLGAALAGVAIGLFANLGRKAIVQGLESRAGDWDDILSTEHEMTLAIFDKMLATDPSQTIKRKMLLAKLTHALDKHAHQEEMVVYPALREANEGADADRLEHEHGQVKTFLYELGNMPADDARWLDTVRQFRDSVSRHAHMEEEQVFPAFKEGLSEEQNAKITSMVNRDGFMMA